jgi:nucleoside-diphosphate-sugar epimerase
MIILITGANGFIGSYLARKLADQHEVILLDIVKSKELDDLPWLNVDLSHDFSIESLPEKVNAIIHLAQAKNYRDYPRSAIEVFKINTFSTIKLLEYGRRRGVDQFIYASSGSVYSGRKKSFRESDLKDPPQNFYALSKYQSELLVKDYRQFMKTVILRFITVYGPGQRGMLIPNLVAKIKKGEKVQIFGPEGVRLNPIYIDDAIEAICSSLSMKSSSVLNVGGVQALSILKMGQVIGDVFGRKVEYEFKPKTKQIDIVGDISKMQSVLGLIPKISFREGIMLIAKKT